MCYRPWFAFPIVRVCSCSTLCDPMDCSPTGCSVSGVSQESILEWVAISFSRGSSWPREEELGCVLWIKGKGEEVMKHKPLRVWCFSRPSSVQCSSVAQYVQLFSTHGLQHARPPRPSPTPRAFKLMSIESVMPSNHLILWRPLLLSPSIFPSSRVSCNESVPRIRWPKYSTLIENPRTGFSLRLCLPKEPELSMKSCCRLVATSSKTTLKPVLKESYYSKAPLWFSHSVMSNSS